MENFRNQENIDRLLLILNDEKYLKPKPGHSRWDDLLNSIQYLDRQFNFTTEEKSHIVQHINAHISHWMPEERNALQEWWVHTEVDDNWEYGVGDIHYESKFVGLRRQPSWLFYLCKKAVLDKSNDGRNFNILQSEDLLILEKHTHLNILILEAYQSEFVYQALINNSVFTSFKKIKINNNLFINKSLLSDFNQWKLDNKIE